MMQLIVRLGSLPVLALPVDRPRLRLGRAPDNDVVLTLPEIAEHHAVIEARDDRIRIVALDAEHVSVDGRTVVESDLGGGKTFGLGGYRLQFLDGDAHDTLVAARSSGTASVAGTRPLPALDPGDAVRAGALRVIVGPDANRVSRLDASITVVGRAPECDIALTDPAVSARHVVLEHADGGLRVRDLESRNGTLLNGRRVESAVANPGDRISIGRSVLELLSSDPSAHRDVVTGLGEMVGGSPVMLRVYARIRDLAESRVPVLILGETGTGKELAARAIHSLGSRSGGPFVPINCTAIPRETLESELFGHERGAFTGATSTRAGAFERAHGGTIFLDEIGQLATDVQPKLLRVVEDGEVPRLGGSSVTSDFRLLCATNDDLGDGVRTGRFREDLYYRLAVEQLVMPPLRDRIEDIPALALAFLAEAEDRWGVRGARDARLVPEAIVALSAHPWPGNVRELRNVMLRATARASRGVIAAEAIRGLIQTSTSTGRSGTSLPEVERATVEKALLDTNGERRAAARRLGIAESTLYEMIKRHRFQDVGRSPSRGPRGGERGTHG